MGTSKTDKELAKNVGLTVEEYDKLVEQVQNELTTSQAFMSPHFEKKNKQLKLYNNQKRKATAVGDPMIFTHFQTILAALYDDKLKVNFAPRTPGDVRIAENLNPLYEFDAVNMDKERIDYDLDWNALFFGRSLCIMSQWDPKLLVPKPEVVNMLYWYRDPNATSVNGDSEGRGAMRFGGRPISMTKQDFRDNPEYKNVEEITDSENSDKEESQNKIDNALGYDSIGDVDGFNENYTIIEWWTKFKKDEDDKAKYVLVGYQDGLIVRYTELKDQDEWPIIERSIYPDSLTWEGVSLVDLIEDKQRANAKLLNAALFNVDSNTYSMGFYDSTKISKASHLNYGHNKRIPVRGSVDGVYKPMETSQVGQEVMTIMGTLQDLAQRATGATEIQQGAVSGAKRTATEVATVSEGADTRFSLSAKIFGWSEKQFARYWYKMYKMYYTKAIDKKVLRVNGLIGFKFKSFKKEDIVGEADPDIRVESKIVSESRRIRERQNFELSYEILAADPTTNKEYLTREWARLNGYNSVQMSMLFKDDPDRMIAKLENKKWFENKEQPIISERDVHWKHIDEHGREEGMEDHIEDHIEMMLMEAKNPEVQEEVQEKEAQQPEFAPVEGGQNFNQAKTIQTA